MCMQKIYRVAIVGGGAAGLMSAVELLSGANAIKGEDVVIIERNDRIGKKLIATGNGQGNLTNAFVSKDNYYGNSVFLDKFIEHVNSVDLEKYLYNMGIPLYTAKDGKKYPLSRQANSFLDVLRIYLGSKGCAILTSTKAEKILKRGEIFTVCTNVNDILAKNLIVATGGKSAKQFGTDGTAYSLVEKFGHSVTELYPSLVQLKCELNLIRGLKGLKETAKVTALSCGKEIKSAVGDVLFTEYGISGNAVFQISGHLTNAINTAVRIEFLPDMDIEEIIKILLDREKCGLFDGENQLLGMLNKRVGQAVLKTAKSKSAKDVAKALKDFNLKITGNLGFNYAQVTKGGIKTEDINAETMESNLTKGMYIVGEMLDVDGDCGGYNLTFAFISGIVAAKNIKEISNYVKT